MKIGNKTIGEGVYVIAEAGVNHNGDLERAKELIRQAAKAGADAIKFQTYTAEELVCRGTPKFWVAESKVDEGLDQYEAYAKIGGFPYEHYPELIKCCEENNIEFLSTAFSFEAADYLNELGMKAFKVASSDMSHLPYLEHIAKFGKPILLSTGASTMEEIQESVETIQKAGNSQIVLLHCTLCYPTKLEDANLSVIQTLKFAYPDLEVGLSDHTLGTLAPSIAVVFGASVIEKHYTVDKTLPDSADHWLSVDPEELKTIVENVKNVPKLFGKPVREVYECEAETRKLDKRSIVSKVAIPKDTVITKEMITYKRPGTGLWPRNVDMVVGALAKRDIPADVPITFDDV